MKVYWFLLMLMFYGCNLFKNVSTDISKSHQSSIRKTDLQLQKDKEWLSKSGSVTFYKDTGNLSYAIQIWPKGMFSFSPEKGFSGVADKIMIEGKVLSGSASSSLNTLRKQGKDKMEMELNQENKQVADSKEKLKQSSPSWKWVILGFVLTVGIYWRLNRKFNF